MQEFPLNLTEAVSKGLTPDVRSPRNSVFATELFNSKVTAYGLRPYQPVNIGFSAGELTSNSVSLSFPFPILFKGKKNTLLIDETALFTVDETTWTLTPVVTYNALDTGQTKSIVTGSYWQVIDFFDTMFLHNGNNSVFKTSIDSMTGGTNKWYVQDGVSIQTGCDFKGRAWMGGFNTSNFYNARMKNLINSYAGKHGERLHTLLGGLDTNFVFWSTIGGGDLLFLFYPELAISGLFESGYGDERPLIFEYLERNEMGSMAMPFQGTVRHMQPLGDFIMVYGDNGVCALRPLADGRVGLIEFPNLSNGIANTGAVNGDQKEHVFIDNTGTVWKIAADLNDTRLGYSNHLSGMLSNTIIVSFDSNEREYYISDGTSSFILTSFGLSKHSQPVTSVINTADDVYGFGVRDTDMADKTFKLVTDVFDFDISGLKTLNSIEVRGSAGNITGKPLYRMNTNTTTFTSVPRAISINKEGYVFNRASALDFKVQLDSTDYTTVNIDAIVARFQASDKRYTRGPQVQV